jgi:hypothetical protein
MNNTRKKFNSRAFISISLFLMITALFLTGLTIQLIEEVAEAENAAPSVIFIVHFCTAIHILCGFTFAILSVFHIVKNWRALVNHLKNKSVTINKETIFAVLLLIALVAVSYFFVSTNF